MPIDKSAFRSCNFDKNLAKNIHNGGRQRLDEKLKSVLESQNVCLPLENIKLIGCLCCFKKITVKNY